MINPESIVALLQSYTVVLDEPGVSQSRATHAARCIGEGLIRACLYLLFYLHNLTKCVFSSRPALRYTRPMHLPSQTWLLPSEHTTTLYPPPHGRSSILSRLYPSRPRLPNQTKPTNFWRPSSPRSISWLKITGHSRCVSLSPRRSRLLLRRFYGWRLRIGWTFPRCLFLPR